MSTRLTNPEARRRPLRLVLGSCALLALCGIALGAVGGGLWWFNRRGTAEAGEPAVEYVVDASTRMALPAEAGTRLTVARGVLAEVIRPADERVTAGLRVFGTGTAPDACQDSNLLVPLGPSNQGRIADRLSVVETGPSEQAPLAEAMVQALRDLSAARGPHTLVVVTGGADSCQPDAAQWIASEAARTGVELAYFVIGFQLTPAEAEALKGMVDSLPGANFMSAGDQDQLRALLAAIQAHIDAPNTTSVSDVLATAQASGTAQATGTAPATSTVVSGSATPAATQVRGATPEGQATGASRDEPQTACDHPYLPLRPGATWTYAGTSGESLIVTVMDVTGDLDHATATLTKDIHGTRDTSTVTCGPEGIRSDGTWGDFVGLSWRFEFGPGWEQTAAEGVWLLPAGQLVPGAHWTAHSAYASNQGRATTRDLALTVAGAEPVTLLGQAMEALRIDRTLGYEAELETSGSGSEWFVRGIGLVKWQTSITTSGVAASTDVELQTYSVP